MYKRIVFMGLAMMFTLACSSDSNGPGPDPDPSEFRVLDEFRSSTYDIHGVVRYGDVLYIIEEGGSWTGVDSALILDISNPNDIDVVGYLNGVRSKLDVDDGILYGVGGTDGALDNMGLRAYNLSNPREPQEIGFFHLSDKPNDLIAEDQYVYMALGDIVTVDATNPGNLHTIGTLDLNAQRDIARLYQHGNLLVACKWVAMYIASISNPASPELLCSVDAVDESVDATISGSTLFVAERNAGVQIYDISSLPTCTNIGSISPTRDSTELVLAYQNVLYVADGSLVLAYDIRDPRNPAKIAEYGAPGMVVSLYADEYIFATYVEPNVAYGLLIMELTQ